MSERFTVQLLQRRRSKIRATEQRLILLLFTVLTRPARGAARLPLLTRAGHAPGLPAQLCRPHLGHHRGDDRGGRQGFPDVGPAPSAQTHTPLHKRTH